ncbi:hypothetical protein ACFWPU_10805 [Streptomyces sp. NPDC058471]|uniref:hypothetical protein n=1 Tax=Streptomyces sp. NPDC058471 TaxID=3346516 RepID=UPI00364AF4CE
MVEPDGGSESTLIRGMAIFAAVVTAALYLLGLLAIGLAVSEVGDGADSTPLRECQDAAHGPQGAHVLGHEVRFIPLDVMCRTTDGRHFASPVVLSWLNPALACSLAGTVIFTVGAIARRIEGRRSGMRAAWAAIPGKRSARAKGGRGSSKGTVSAKTESSSPPSRPS